MANFNNKCEFKGNLTKDAQYTVTPSGKLMYKFSLAVSTGKPKMENGQQVMNGEKPVYEVMFIEFTAWGKTAESLVNGSMHPLMAKGAMVRVEARFDGVQAYMKSDNSGPAASANFVITSPLDIAIIGTSFNQREDGATYNPSSRMNNNQQGRQPSSNFGGSQSGYGSGSQQQNHYSSPGSQSHYGGQPRGEYAGGFNDSNDSFPY